MSNKVYVIGVGMTKFEKPGRRENWDYPDMARESGTEALEDAGIDYAAIEHLAQQRAQGAIREIARVEASSDPVSMVLEFLWEAHQGPMFVATVELWVAARTDDVLAGHIERVEPLVNSTLISAIAQLVPDHAMRKELRNFVYTAMDALRGILLNSFVDRDSGRARRRWERACEHLRVIVAGLLTADSLD